MVTTLLVAIAAVGVESGWTPLEGGGLEYIIQIEPELIGSLQEGMELTSEVPPELADLRRWRIRLGDGPLPRSARRPPLGASAETAGPPAAEAPRNAPRWDPFERDPPPSKAEPLAGPRFPQRPAAGSRYAEPEVVGQAAAPNERREPSPATIAPGTGSPPRRLALPAQPRYEPLPSARRTGPGAGGRSVLPAGGATVATPRERETPVNTVAATGPIPPLPKAAKKQDAEKPVAAARRWLPLSLALLGLVGSATLNCYLAAIWLDTRRRFQGLVEERHSLRDEE